MQHTYLRYECADAFSLTTSAATTSTSTTSPLAFLSTSNSRAQSTLLSTSGSQILGFNLRTNEPSLKIAHRELLSGGLGTGKALNSNEVLCITTTKINSVHKVATGWKDGSIRVFDLTTDDMKATNDNELGLAHSLLFHQAQDREEFVTRDPLLLNGHSGSPITCLAFNDHGTTTALASGSSDGTIILWDILNGRLYY
jgi:WD40 repeat protein